MAYVPNSETGYVHAEAVELDKKLKLGDGILWTGDPRLELRMGILTAPHALVRDGRRYPKGAVVARRYEVWRYCEDGTEQRIGSWRLEEFDRILMDLAPMRMDAPNRVDTQTKIDAANKKLEDEKSAKVRDTLGGVMEHAASLVADTTGPKTTFRQMPGSRDEAK